MFNTLGRIAELQRIKGWSRYKFAKVSGIPASTISTWYNKNICPSIFNVEIICNAFGITLSEFYRTDNDVPRGLTGEQAALLDAYMGLSPVEKDAVWGVLKAFQKR